MHGNNKPQAMDHGGLFDLNLDPEDESSYRDPDLNLGLADTMTAAEHGRLQSKEVTRGGDLVQSSFGDPDEEGLLWGSSLQMCSSTLRRDTENARGVRQQSKQPMGRAATWQRKTRMNHPAQEQPPHTEVVRGRSVSKRQSKMGETSEKRVREEVNDKNQGKKPRGQGDLRDYTRSVQRKEEANKTITKSCGGTVHAREMTRSITQEGPNLRGLTNENRGSGGCPRIATRVQ